MSNRVKALPMTNAVVRVKNSVKLFPKSRTVEEKPNKFKRETQLVGGGTQEGGAPHALKESAAGGRSELNALMARTVDAELQDIMIKVWQELPDDPPNDAEKLVVDKFRNKTGDDLRNVLGLNVAKRLLNVFNPLYVKLKFNTKPERSYLAAFIKKYNLHRFRQIEKCDRETYAAQMRSIQDFDRICAAKLIRCGKTRVMVIPGYKFTKCPPNLRTPFDNEMNIEASQKKGAEEKAQVNTKTVKSNPKASEEKNTIGTIKVESKTVSEQKLVNPPPSKSVLKPANSPPSQYERKPANPPSSKSELKPAKTLQVMNKEKEKDTKLLPNKSKDNKTLLGNVADKKNTTNITKTIDKLIKQEKHLEVKPNRGKQATKTIQITPSPRVKTADTRSPTKSVLQKGNDFDELDDHDILALITEGVVLDECSGSEDE